jgi:hypothetical protein
LREIAGTQPSQVVERASPMTVVGTNATYGPRRLNADVAFRLLVKNEYELRAN